MDDPVKRKLHVLNLLEAHLAAGNRDTVAQAINGHVHENTLRNWLKDKESVPGKYKSDALIAIGRDLPSVEDVRTAAVFSFALAELGLQKSSQAELTRYHGRYYLHHRFHLKHVTRLQSLNLNARDAPNFASFFLSFRHLGTRSTCDGLAVITPRRLRLLGLSRHAIMMAYLQPVADPTRNLILGSGSFESIDEGGLSYSNIVLHQRPLGVLTREEKQSIDEHVRRDLPRRS